MFSNSSLLFSCVPNSQENGTQAEKRGRVWILSLSKKITDDSNSLISSLLVVRNGRILQCLRPKIKASGLSLESVETTINPI